MIGGRRVFDSALSPHPTPSPTHTHHPPPLTHRSLIADTYFEGSRNSPITAIRWLWRLGRNTRTPGTPPRTNTTLYSCLARPFYAKPHDVSRRPRPLFAGPAYRIAAVRVIRPPSDDVTHVPPPVRRCSAATSAMLTRVRR